MVIKIKKRGLLSAVRDVADGRDYCDVTGKEAVAPADVRS